MVKLKITSASDSDVDVQKLGRPTGSVQNRRRRKMREIEENFLQQSRSDVCWS
jgi:hypothetical protein